MCVLTFAALLGLAAGCPPPGPALRAPADPATAQRFRPPPSPLAGLKPYQPVEARADWGSPTAPGGAARSGGAMPGMPGMSMPGMDGGGAR